MYNFIFFSCNWPKISILALLYRFLCQLQVLFFVTVVENALTKVKGSCSKLNNNHGGSNANIPQSFPDS